MFLQSKIGLKLPEKKQSVMKTASLIQMDQWRGAWVHLMQLSDQKQMWNANKVHVMLVLKSAQVRAETRVWELLYEDTVHGGFDGWSRGQPWLPRGSVV